MAEAQAKVEPLLPMPPTAPSGAASSRRWRRPSSGWPRMFAVSLVLIAVLLYLAFRSLLDAAVVFANVLAMSLGGVWALEADRAELQHLGGGRVHLDPGRGGDERPAVRLRVQRACGARHGARRRR